MDNRFFTVTGAVSVQALANILNLELHISDELDANQCYFCDIASFENAGEASLCFLANKKYLTALEQTKALGVILEPKYLEYAQNIKIKLVSNTPYYSYAKALEYFYSSIQEAKNKQSYIAPNATIATNAKIGSNVYIAANVVIEDSVEIGDNVVIDANSVIKYGVRIGNNSKVYSNCTLQYTEIGQNVIIHPGVRIGQDGFGFAFASYKHNKVLHIGRVIIEDDVEIGANTSIDRGSVNDTVVGKGSKIDNLVQLGHNVKVGKNVIIVAQTGIAGSTEIGDYAVIGGQVGIAGHIKIGAKVQIAAQSGVVKDIEDGSIVGGTPAVNIKDWHRQSLALQKMIKKGS
ncbi:UDP-3-O-(3-hydroxymyristoyl)glucosamine N-acyltransferase [Rickettsiales endosymbiont of Stachyamoeba lipophora]|uniref:UDP-3-O-(3-hydroxymyristoyl)glucosamine N-acyltransferase n=1 Tax=Rickettsiales endosymbiont of Stachyamoeba lipophora TaxID=2486578 RepID=UPI000F64720A|nr:UDP-3-O-(3-hydroxymyristoyl)glucosamine N-acyltransferase [Rickettsiales endosymbiont of Stachyamoeba lipophora]AZL15778.1 UDP-3-O-(3-hydroxymyristoyl)glucosamine N-acyltransferase [Rickettsiales endosymbiont of Stachyamoeba lipophora]